MSIVSKEFKDTLTEDGMVCVDPWTILRMSIVSKESKDTLAGCMCILGQSQCLRSLKIL